ncbi:MAG: hypothetical protein EXR79_15400 [Myxococcales bacterium]|nr:hypothetical protein [Myxococcales bacterium]
MPHGAPTTHLHLPRGSRTADPAHVHCPLRQLVMSISWAVAAGCAGPAPASQVADSADPPDTLASDGVAAPEADAADAAPSGPAPIFSPDLVHVVAVTVPAADWAALLANAKNPKLPRAFAKAEVRIDGLSYASAGIRNFGDGSQQGNPAKPNVRIKFDAFESARRGPEQLKNLRLKAGGTEPTFLREPLFYEALRALGAPALRWGFARVRVNDVPYGFYQVFEQIDEQMITKALGSKEGASYEPAEVCYGLNCPAGGCAKIAEQYDAARGDKADLIALVTAIAAPASPQWAAGVGKLADLDHLLDAYAAEAVAADLDGLAASGTNFELAGDPKTGRLHVMRAGGDEVFMHPYNLWQPWGPPNILCPGRVDQFYQRAVADPGLKAELATRFRTLHCGVLALATVLPWLDALRDRLRAEVAADPKTHHDKAGYDDDVSELKSWLVKRNLLLDNVVGTCK